VHILNEVSKSASKFSFHFSAKFFFTLHIEMKKPAKNPKPNKTQKPTGWFFLKTGFF